MIRNSYTSIAAVYDKLNSEVNYSAYADYIERKFSLFAKEKPLSVLDLACGTGSMTAELAARGYDMTGIDLSEEMLAIARAKCDEKRFAHQVLLVQQDMTGLELYGTVQAAVCCLDSLNYLTDTGALERTLSHMHNYIEPDGLFIFDMNAPAKFERVYSDNAYVLEDDGILCAWQNEYNRKTKLCDFYLSIFRECDDGRWERHDETQRERCYSLRTIKKLLGSAGFEILAVEGDFSGAEVNNDTERWYFTVKRI